MVTTGLVQRYYDGGCGTIGDLKRDEKNFLYQESYSVNGNEYFK